MAVLDEEIPPPSAVCHATCRTEVCVNFGVAMETVVYLRPNGTPFSVVCGLCGHTITEVVPVPAT
ncbi:hypothetical protein [Streptomyces niveus]|uniref:hypothetical protein n=1 Tax=Streptomyces niveus TaxID=193462 RepID=UPI00343B64E5